MMVLVELYQKFELEKSRELILEVAELLYDIIILKYTLVKIDRKRDPAKTGGVLRSDCIKALQNQ